MKFEKNGKEWQVIKVYDKFYLCECKTGYKECFYKYEVNKNSMSIYSKHNKVVYLDNEPIFLREIMKRYKLTYSQVKYRIKTKKRLPDNKIIKEHIFL